MRASDAISFNWAQLPSVQPLIIIMAEKPKPTKFQIVLQSRRNLHTFKVICLCIYFACHGKMFLSDRCFIGT